VASFQQNLGVDPTGDRAIHLGTIPHP